MLLLIITTAKIFSPQHFYLNLNATIIGKNECMKGWNVIRKVVKRSTFILIAIIIQEFVQIVVQFLDTI